MPIATANGTYANFEDDIDYSDIEAKYAIAFSFPPVILIMTQVSSSF